MPDYKNFSKLRKSLRVPAPSFAAGEGPELNRYGNIPGGLSQEELVRELVLRDMAGKSAPGTPAEEIAEARKFQEGLDPLIDAASLSSPLMLEKGIAGLAKSSKGFSSAIRNMARKLSKGDAVDQAAYAKVDPARSKRIADAYEAMKHDPSNPEVKEAYEALAKEVQEQYKAIKDMGIVPEPIPSGGENPYAKGASDMIEDVQKNKRIKYFSTDDGFGSAPLTPEQIADNPMLAETAEMAGGKPMRVNDQFRVVHDVFGHAKEGPGFGPVGEENAWQAHRRMFSPKAAKAMTTETRGQNSWVNYGPFGEANRANPGNTRYADQKSGLLPDWVMDEGLVPTSSEYGDVAMASRAMNAPKASESVEDLLPDEQPMESNKFRALASILNKKR